MSKYGEYAHGDAMGERRVVLEKAIVPEVSDTKVVDTSETLKWNDLREMFLETLRSECQEAILNDQAVLVLIFACGQPGTGSNPVGGHRESARSPRLGRRVFRQAIPPKARVAMLTTSCYGGGWTQMLQMNATAMAAGDDEHELLHWPRSAGYGRLCGSRDAAAATETLVRMSFPEWQLEDDGDFCELEMTTQR